MELLVRLAWVGALVNLASAAPSILITAPNIFHVDVAESVALQVEGLSSPAQINVYFQNQKTNKKCSETDTFTLDSSNNYIQVKKMKVSANQIKNCDVDSLLRKKYIQLVAESVVKAGQVPLLAKARMIPILLSTKKGYLFIQTDKPIYTPSQEVKFRVFTLDHVMRPVQDSVSITVYNAQGMQVKKDEIFSEKSIINHQFKIPDISDPGVWTIMAKFASSPESNSSAQFEVKKYVLPNFEVKISPDKPFFLVTEKAFNFIVEASYVYGKSVVGVAYVRFAIMDEAGEKIFLRGTEQQITLADGKAQVILARENITKAMTSPQKALNDLKGMRLHIAVTVLETATGVLEEQELNSVKFVTSPYMVDLSKTKLYFVPGASINILVGVSHTDGSTAAKIPVTLNVKINGNPEPPKEAGRSDESGMLFLTINTSPSARTVEISASVGIGDNTESSTMTVNAYQSSSQSYLHILPQSHGTVKPGGSVAFQLQPITTSKTDISYLYYMVLNKGQILFLKREKKTTLTSIQFMATGEMMPSFRFVAYYYLGDEIVANSVWMDVEDSCEGKLHVQTDGKNYYDPGKELKVTIETDDHALVALAAVDSAVYILNKKNKLTPKKVFQAMNEYDLGCTVGSGKDFKGVFKDAGLSFISSQSFSELREGYGCNTPKRRMKRALDFQTLINDKIRRFTDDKQKKCCRSGLALLPPHMKRTCKERSDRVSDARCRGAFLECCTFAVEQRKKYRRVTSGLGRVYSEDEDEDYEDEDIQLRSSFPESWLWKTVSVNKKFTEHTFVPDSITTWEIQAISMSKGRGFCIAEPLRVKVFQPFHIHLPLPYSVKRFEQLEIRPTLYNYAEVDLEMRVSMDKADGLCSPSTAGPKENTIVTVPKNSAIAVPFSIVPMTKHNIPITVTAVGENGGDKISKILRIVREGVSKLDQATYAIDLHGEGEKVLEILGIEPPNLIPDGDFTTSVRVSADSALETVNNSLAADGVSRLIQVPYGCAEQTMVNMAPGVYAIKYLDETEQWTSLAPERKDEALETIKGGYLRILSFRKGDGSYGAWLTTPSSTWLTAFIAKILSICRDHITIDDNHILTAVNFILKHQVESTGAFQDPAPVWHREMQGGIGGLEGEVSLTAFVTIALHHTMGIHFGQSKSNVRKSIEKAEQYLHQKLPSLKHTYTVAISVYALTLVSNSDAVKQAAHGYLMDFSTESRDGRMLYWETTDADRLQSETNRGRAPSAAAITVEGTAFALMHMLLWVDIPRANKIATWMTEQQNYGGGFKSTQDTVVALEALSKYWTETFSAEGANMDFTITSPERSYSKKFRVDKNTKQVQEQLQFSLANKLRVELRGKGKGTLTILRLFNVMQVENSTCQQMKLDVELTEEVKEIDEAKDYETDYDYGDEVSDEPFAPIHWQDLRRRRRREARQPQDDKKVVVYKVCLWRVNQSNGSGMAIVDITMLSGFVPEMEDLNKLKDLEDRYISHYEYQHGRLILYFPSVPHQKECISFQAIQNVKVGLLQPASATLYDFYEPDRKCNIFYNLPSKSKLVSALCTDDVCQCAEGPCPKKKVTVAINENTDPDPRQNHACYSPRVKYGYRGLVLDSWDQNAFVVYKVQITEVLQRTKDEEIDLNSLRNFIQRKACKMQLTRDKEYLLMGQDGNTYDESGELQYLLEANSWIEELASPGTCKATRNRAKCQRVQNFMGTYKANGCMV